MSASCFCGDEEASAAVTDADRVSRAPAACSIPLTNMFFLNHNCSPPPTVLVFLQSIKFFTCGVWLSIWREDLQHLILHLLRYFPWMGKILENDGENKSEMLKFCNQVQFRCFLFSSKIAHYNITPLYLIILFVSYFANYVLH